MENKYKLKKEYEIKSYESNSRKEIKPHMLLHYFEDIAYDSAENLGFGYSQIYLRGLAWFVLKYRINITRTPKTWEKINMTTWPSENKGALCRREFTLKDKEDNTILSASSLWGLVDINKKRLVNAKKVLDYPILAEDYATDTDFSAINTDKDFTQEKELEILYDDIDLNSHVNNANYVSWVYNSINYDKLKKLSIKEIDIDYKSEATFGNIITVKNTEIINDISYHKIMANDVECANMLIKWH